MNELLVYKNRTNVVQVDLGFDVSTDVLTSEIRAGKNLGSSLIATWAVSFLTDGTDGKLVLTLDDSDLDSVSEKVGYMDLKRVSAGEPLPVFANPIKVKFLESVTS